MKKLFLLSFTLTTILFNTFSQSIIPLRTDEFCPNVNTTFTVTLAANSIQSIVSKALDVAPTVITPIPFNISTSGTNITFSFTG